MGQNSTPSVFVSLDLETTGLDTERDAIIEIGAVKFRGSEVIDTYQTLVNPFRQLPDFIKRLTGITQRSLDRAVPFAAVAGELEEFIGDLPIVGHNIEFDMKFLASHGLTLANDSYDTWDLASVLLPYSTEYSLSSLAPAMGADHNNPHRALSDAQATHGVFVNLLGEAEKLDQSVANTIGRLAARSQWKAGGLMGRRPDSESSPAPIGSDIETLSLSQRLTRSSKRPRRLSEFPEASIENLSSVLEPGGLVAQAFPGFERRPEQASMTDAVAGAIAGNRHLMVEAGTGVGKSLAYLIPAIVYSVQSGDRVVVSTNTINLQEQLLKKDIPDLVNLLEEGGMIPRGEFKVASLKGRANYMCLRRWEQMARSESLNVNEARLLSKTLLWLQDTETGDRAEINLAGRDAFTWNRISSAEAGQCTGTRGEGPCFLRSARDKAEGAHIVVINHALLLSDLAIDGGVLPEYQHIIIDEAHNLEEGATRQLGFQVSETLMDDTLEALARILTEVSVLLNAPTVSPEQRQLGRDMVEAFQPRWAGRMRERWARLWNQIDSFLMNHAQNGDSDQLRITRGTRSQPAWSEVELNWENVDAVLGEASRLCDNLVNLLDNIDVDGPITPESVVLDLSGWEENVSVLRDRLRTLLGVAPKEERIDWITRERVRGGDASKSAIVINSAPLHVGRELDSKLFSQKSSVVLTSATLTVGGEFNYTRERTGLQGADELTVGSPFDYQKAALLMVPEDMPNPDSFGYQEALENLLVSLTHALAGRTLALFTSHASLRKTAQAIRGAVEAEGLRVLAQGIDGSPAQIMRSFSSSTDGIILGTSSFWEGVDLSDGALKALVIARLPFNVPTDPIFSARSEGYEEPFTQYAIPQAALRFRQGFGRLIRGSGDRGSVVVADKRITSRSYGKIFLRSLPPVTFKKPPLSAVADEASLWAAGVMEPQP